MEPSLEVFSTGLGGKQNKFHGYTANTLPRRTAWGMYPQGIFITVFLVDFVDD